MRELGVRDLARCQELTTIDDGEVTPLVVVHFDGPDCSERELAEAIENANRSDALLVGVSSRPLSPSLESLARSLTCTVGPDRTCRYVVDADAAALVSRADANPIAAGALASLLRLTDSLGVRQGLVAESLAYSMLLAGREFKTWREARPPRTNTPTCSRAPVDVERTAHCLTLTLNRPDRRNAFSRAMRDALLEGLQIAAFDTAIREVRLRGAGLAFCAGGDLDEFGTAEDQATAHLVRLAASAGLAIHRLGARARPTLHGACIGAGIEIPAFAGHVTAMAGAWFQLPELSMGLVPGAGGTVSITRRIGRWRTAYMVLSGAPVDAECALDWGLVDELVA